MLHRVSLKVNFSLPTRMANFQMMEKKYVKKLDFWGKNIIFYIDFKKMRRSTMKHVNPHIDVNKHYVKASRTMFNIAFEKLSGSQFKLYFFIYQHIDNNKGFAELSASFIMSKLGIKSKATLYEQRKVLVEKGFIDIVQIKKKDGSFGRTRFFLICLDERNYMFHKTTVIENEQPSFNFLSNVVPEKNTTPSPYGDEVKTNIKKLNLKKQAINTQEGIGKAVTSQKADACLLDNNKCNNGILTANSNQSIKHLKEVKTSPVNHAEDNLHGFCYNNTSIDDSFTTNSPKPKVRQILNKECDLHLSRVPCSNIKDKKEIEKEFPVNDNGSICNHNYVLDRLKEIDISGEPANELAREYCTNYLLLCDYIELVKLRRDKIKNTRTYLIRAIKDNYDLASVFAKQKAKKTQENARQERDKESKERDKVIQEAREEVRVRGKAQSQYKNLTSDERKHIDKLVLDRMYKENPYLEELSEGLRASMMTMGRGIILATLYQEGNCNLRMYLNKNLKTQCVRQV